MRNQAGFIAVLVFEALLLPLPSRAAESSRAAGLDLPPPNGCHPVGTRTVVLRDAKRGRDLLLTTWYPAGEAASPVAPYMDEKTGAALAAAWKLEPNFHSRVHAHARMQAPIAQGPPFPVVLLEHGAEVVPAIYTVLAEGLASSGFIVVATNHPPASLVAVFPDGHEAKFAPYWPEAADRRTQGVAMGKFVDDVLVADVRFVLDQLQEMNAHDPFWRSHMDLSKVGIIGHSLGGATAALATREERRILAGVNLDGSAFPGLNADVFPIPVRKPLLFLATEEHAASQWASHDGPPRQAGEWEYVGSESNTYYVVVTGANHGSFTDAGLLTSRFSRGAKTDDGAFARAVLASTLTRGLVEEFLAKYLQAGTAPALDLTVRIDKK